MAGAGIILPPAIAFGHRIGAPGGTEDERDMSETPPAADRSSDGAAAEAGQRTGRGRFILLLAGFAVFAYVFDQLTKLWVTSTMTEGERIPVLPPLLHWYYIRNSGAAFSIGENVTWVFTIIMAAVVARDPAPAAQARLRLVGAGAGAAARRRAGQPDRPAVPRPSFGMGHVVDFIQLPNFAIFNIADSAVVVGGHLSAC